MCISEEYVAREAMMANFHVAPQSDSKTWNMNSENSPV